MSPRYGQLAYTSFDTAGSAGGWQVKQTTGALTAHETQALVAGVRTVFRPAEELPAYPSSEELARGPRRLAYRRLGPAAAGYWHTVPAGADATGRPGNVFAHVLLDREPTAINATRPICWWRSPGWSCPYGPAAVAKAALPHDIPQPGTTVTKDSVIAFALDTATFRLPTLFGLLDAVAAALAGGPAVVLGAESADSAAQWIGLLSFLMSAGTAASFNFSTFDRAEGLTPALQAGQHLTAMPRADLADLPADVIVIDEIAALSVGELGGQAHRTAAGQAIEVTAFSAMAQVVLLDPGPARQALDDIDHYASIAGDDGLHPAWPLAMTVTARDEFADAAAEAHTVIAAHSPRGAAPDSVVGRTLADVVAAAAGHSTAQAWQAVQHTPDGAGADLIDITYLRRAMADDTWLDQLGPIPVGPRTLHGHPAPAELTTGIGPALTDARHAGPARVARLVDLLIRAGVDDDRLSPALAEDVVPHLRDQQAGPGLVHRLGHRIGPATRLAITAELLKAGVAPDGSVPVVAAVLDWLADGVAAPPAAMLADAATWDTVWLSAALRGVRALQVAAEGSADRRAGLWWLRVAGSPRFPQLAANHVWDPADLLAAAGPAPLAGGAAVPTLVGAPDSPALTALAHKVTGQSAGAHNDDVAVACAALRLADLASWVSEGFVESHQMIYTPLWERALIRARPGGPHHDFVVRLLALAVVAAIAGRPYPAGCDTLTADPNAAAQAVALVNTLTDTDVVIPTTVLAVRLLRAPETNGDNDIPTPGVDALLDQVARHTAASRNFDDEAIEATATLMAQLAGEESGGTLRRNRKAVTKLIAAATEAQAGVAAKTHAGEPATPHAGEPAKFRGAR